MQSPPDQPGRHSAQNLPLMKKSSLGPHVPLLQRLQFSNTLQPGRKTEPGEILQESRSETECKVHKQFPSKGQHFTLVLHLSQPLNHCIPIRTSALTVQYCTHCATGRLSESERANLLFVFTGRWSADNSLIGKGLFGWRSHSSTVTLNLCLCSQSSLVNRGALT